MTKHSNGPWSVTPTLTGALSINLTPSVPIATVGGAGWHLGRDVAEANARLIAAAPDMLDALQMAINLTLDEEDVAHAAFLKAARNAIAKATNT